MAEFDEQFRNLLAKLRALTPEHRQQRLSEMPPALRERMTALLSAQGASPALDETIASDPGMIETVASDSALAQTVASDSALMETTAAAPAVRGPRPRQLVPGYEIIGDKPIGEGGMGVVWKATQASTKRIVALKLMSAASFGSERARRRFEREVELTAKLDHPHIARIYDSGLHAGACYYAMELIEGVELDKFCKQRALTPQQLIELMVAVCRAVQFAHQKGIIHRDLKPSNILVDQAGQPHVLDFGLAKAVEGDTELSIDGQPAGTPVYMSPEQAAGHADAIDTRSDVYTLGVILFYLLSGAFPHDISGSALDVMERIRIHDPARLRQIAPAANRELEVVLEKAMSREPQRRYGSAGELADDLERFLRGDPLSAQPPTISYLFAKKLRKFRVPIAAGSAIFAALLAMGVWSYVRVRSEKLEALRLKGVAESNEQRAIKGEAEAKEQKEAAQRNAQIAAKQRDLALGTIHDLIFEVRDKLNAPGLLEVKKSVYELALNRLQQIQSRAGDIQADRQGAVARHQIGEVLELLGKPAEARAAFLEAIGIAERLLASHPDDKMIPMDLSVFYNALGAQSHLAGDLAQARECFSKSVAMAQRVVAFRPAADHALEQITTASANLGKICTDLDDLSGAQQWVDKAIEAGRALAKLKPAQQGVLANALYRAGRLAHAKREFTAARDFYTQSIAIAEKGDRTDIEMAYNGLGETELALNNPTAAKAHLEQAQAIIEAKVQADPANQFSKRDLGLNYNTLGRMHLKAHDFPAARGYFEKELAVAEARLKVAPASEDAQRQVAVACVGLGDALESTDADSAEKHYRRALAIFEKSAKNGGTNNSASFVRIAASRLAKLNSRRGNYDAAREPQLKWVAFEEARFKTDPSNTQSRLDLATALNFLGELERKRGDHAAAGAAHEKVVAMCTDQSVAANADFLMKLADAYTGLGDTALAANDLPAAMAFRTKCLAIEEQLAQAQPDDAKLQHRLANAYMTVADSGRAQKDWRAAQALCEKAETIWQRLLEVDAKSINYQHGLARAGNINATARMELGDAAGALEYFTRQVPRLESIKIADPSDIWVRTALPYTYQSLATLNYQARNLEAAKAAYQKLLPLVEADHQAAPKDPARFNTVWTVYRRLGTISRTLRQLPEATAWLQKFLAMSQKWAASDENDPMPLFAVCEAYLHLGTVKELAQEYAPAADLYKQGLETARKLDAKFKFNHPGYVSARGELQSHFEFCQKAATNPPAR